MWGEIHYFAVFDLMFHTLLRMRIRGGGVRACDLMIWVSSLCIIFLRKQVCIQKIWLMA